MAMEHIVVLTGAGISAESGLRTFRDADGLWENHNVYDVATPEAWQRDPELVLRFYNERRRDVAKAEPNAAHKALVDLEEAFDVTIITQNIDDLHERAGSSRVVHLHGQITQARGVADEDLLIDISGKDISLGDLCPNGSQLRPHVVWFGESVPMIPEAARITESADRMLIVGTSLSVYPAASLVGYAPSASPKYLIDPHIPELVAMTDVHCIEATASAGLPQLVQDWLSE